MENAVIEINDSLVLAFAHQDQAMLLLEKRHTLVSIDMAELEDSHDVIKCPATIQHVVHKMKRATQMIQDAMDVYRGKTLILCQTSKDQSALQETALLFGASAILVEEWDLDNFLH